MKLYNLNNKLLCQSDHVPENFTGIVEYVNSKSWYKEGNLHRENGPAIEYADGYKTWYKEGKLHRENGPAKEYADGSKSWYKEGKLHRENGPAIEYANGNKFWYKEGNLHRENGPAIEYADGVKTWYLNDVQYSEQEFNNIYPNNPEVKILNPSAIAKITTPPPTPRKIINPILELQIIETP